MKIIFPMKILCCLMLSFILTACCTGVCSSASDVEETLPFPVGEVVEYDIKKMIDVGNMVLTFEGATRIDGKEVYHLHLRAESANFDDDDHIYLDPTTFYPIKVTRDVSMFGDERIVEDYDPVAGKVTITKTARGKTETQEITKNGPLENVYGFIYRYRLNDSFNPGERMFIRLPTMDVTMVYRGEVDIKIRGDVYRAHYLESEPDKFKIWLTTKDNSLAPGHNIPIRIDGAVGFGDTAMVFKNYE